MEHSSKQNKNVLLQPLVGALIWAKNLFFQKNIDLIFLRPKRQFASKPGPFTSQMDYKQIPAMHSGNNLSDKNSSRMSSFFLAPTLLCCNDCV
jgi:hypothetical protein